MDEHRSEVLLEVKYTSMHMGSIIERGRLGSKTKSADSQLRSQESRAAQTLFLSPPLLNTV